MTKQLQSKRKISQQRTKDAINAALELFHKRWTLRILWELRAGPLLFRELGSACGDLSTSVLNVRLSELREALLVHHDAGAGYRLSDMGVSLVKAATPLLEWAPGWADAVARSGLAGKAAAELEQRSAKDR